MTSPAGSRLIACTLAALACCAQVSSARAQSSESARAEQLFNDGKARLAEHDFAQACPLLAESFRAEPATGALLALALCHEHAGKLASAQREYTEAAARSHREQRADRELAARDRASALASSVSTLTIDGGAAGKGSKVELNGAPLEAERLGRAIAVDGGEHTVVATAPGKRAWSVQLQVASSADAQRVVIPALEDAHPMATPAARASTQTARRDSPALSAEAWVGLGALGAGAVALGAGTVLAIRAGGEPPPTSGGCVDGTCTYRASNDDTDGSLLCFVVGGVLAASGAVIYLVSGPTGSSDRAANGHLLTAQAFVLPGSGGASVRGNF